MHEKLKEALQGHYDIDREVGRGGMASVFLAHDIKHGRRVAIKVLHPELAAAVGPQRFLREIETAARLTHPHILSLHESGERDGLLYYVMPFVEGESLRERLTRTPQLPIDEAQRIISDVGDALRYAHEHGVVHRDIKPENILLAGRHAIVADFGIARALERSAGDTLTATGVTLGTPHYMSPEQAAGDHDVDPRSDIYALGCVLYEMLAGEPPYVGPTIQSIIAKHITAPVPTVRTLRPTVPLRVERVIARALVKSPADRYPTVAAFLQDLEADEPALGSEATTTKPPPAQPAPLATEAREHARRPRVPRRIGVVAAIAGALALVIWLLNVRPGERPDARLQSLAVLPFDDVGSATESTYFADGITDEIIDVMSRIPGLRVISRTSAFAFKQKRGLTLAQIADSLNVDAIIEGSVRRDGNRLRVIARLIDVATDSQLLGRNFDRELRDVFALQNEIAQEIATVLRVQLTGQASRRVATTQDVAAYDLYLRGRALWNQRSPAALREAVSLFEQAVQRDSGFVAAYVGLSDALALLGLVGGAPPNEVAQRAVDVAKRALELDSLDGGAHAAYGHASYEFFRDLTGEAHLRRALQLDSVSYGARIYLAILRHDLGFFDEAIELARDALERDPLAPAVRSNLGRLFLSAGNFDSAEAHLRAGIALSPTWANPRAWLAHLLIARNKPNEAVEEFRRAAATGAGPLDSTWLAYGLAATGHRDQAKVILKAVTAERRKRANLETALAIAYAALEDWDQAFTWLERHIQVGYGHPQTYLRLPGGRALTGHPRFADIARRIGMRQ